MTEPADAKPPERADEPRVFKAATRPPDRLARWGRRALKIALIAVIGFLPGYIVLVNVMLSTNLVAKLVSYNPELAAIKYDSAWSVWPTVVHVKGLEVRGSDSVLQWVVQLDEVTCDIKLTELLNRKFYARDVNAKGFVFRVRLRVDPADAEKPETLALPSIPGFTNPPLLRSDPEEPITDENYNLWTAHLDNIDTTMREIWIQQYRYIGEGRVRGGFYFKPLRVMQVDPTVIELYSGEVQLAEHVVTRLTGHMVVTANPFDPRNVDGLNIFETVTTQIALDAQMPGLEFINFHAGPSSGVRIEDGSGVLRTNLILHKGLLYPGSSLTFATAHVGVNTPELQVDAGGDVELLVKGGDEAGAHFTARVPRATATRTGKKGLPPAEAENLLVALRSDALSLTSLPTKFSAKVSVPAAVLPDLRWLNREGAEPDAPVFTGGAAFLRGNLEMSEDGKGTGALRTLVKHAAVRFKETSIQADGVAELALESANAMAKTASLRNGKVEVSEVVFRHKGQEFPPWWAKVDIESAKLGQDLIEARIKLKCKDAQPAVGLLDAEDEIPGWAAGFLTLEGLTASADVKRSNTMVDFRLLKAEGGGFEFRGRLKKQAKEKPEGAFLVRAGPLSVGISIEQDGTGVTPLAGDGWIDEKMVALDRR